MQSNFWADSKNVDRHKTFCDLQKDKALIISAQFKPDAEQVCVSVRSLEMGQDNSPQNNSQCLIISEFFKLLSWSRWKKVSIKELNRDQYVGCSLDQNYKFTIVSGELLTLECRNFLRIQTCRSGPPRAVDFWQARMPQWRPLHQRTASGAAVFYFSKFSQGPSHFQIFLRPSINHRKCLR